MKDERRRSGEFTSPHLPPNGGVNPPLQENYKRPLTRSGIVRPPAPPGEGYSVLINGFQEAGVRSQGAERPESRQRRSDASILHPSQFILQKKLSANSIQPPEVQESEAGSQGENLH